MALKHFEILNTFETVICVNQEFDELQEAISEFFNWKG